MRPYHEREWHGIEFAAFATVSSHQLADVRFYDAFYRELFRRYRGYDELDEGWRRRKQERARWIGARLPPGARVLSIGCGIGYMEHCLQQDRGGGIELHVHEPAAAALSWLRCELPENRIHVAAGDAAKHAPFDVVYLSALDYALPQPAMIALLAEQRAQLRAGGTCLIVSASFLPDASWIRRVRDRAGDGLRWFLEWTRIRHRGQFWGWMRSRADYQELFRASGYAGITDGFIETPHQRTYVIEGHR
jgi:SAM-dependent methyltransferase